MISAFYHTKLDHTQSGNILIYILGAIFLLGLLVMTVKGSFSPGAGIDEESLMIRVSEIQEYGAELERAVTYVIANGHSENDIRFAHPDAAVAYGNITSVPTRQVFAAEGGGAHYRSPPTDIQTTPSAWVFIGENNIPGIGSNNADLIAMIPNVTLNFCLTINQENDIDNPSDSPPDDPDTFDNATPFAGTFTNSETIGTIAINGLKKEGCLEGGGTPAAGTYHYYRVLYAR